MKGLLSLALFLGVLVQFIQARLISSSYTMVELRRKRGWIFLDRMTSSPGELYVKFSTRLQLKDHKDNKQYMLQLAIVPDRLWAEEALLQCSKTSASSQEQVGNRQSDVNKQRTLVTSMSLSNQLYNSQQLTIPISYQQTYHFILRDCERSLMNQYFSRDATIQVTLNLLNNGKEHGEEESSNLFVLPLTILLTAAMIRMTKGLRKSLNGEIDFAKIILNVGLWMNLAALLFKFSNYFIYVYVSGKEYRLLDFMYLLMHSLSESIIITLIIFVAYGWTISFLQTKEFDLYIPLLAMLGLVNVLLTMLGKINDKQHNKYHMYDSIPSYLLIGLRVITLLIFCVGVSFMVYKKWNYPNILHFYKRFAVVGGVYILSLPIVIFGSHLFKESARKQLVFLTIEIMKNLINLILTYMITSKTSNYKSIQFDSKSFMEMEDGKYK